MTIKVGSQDVQSIHIGSTVETTEAWTRPNVTSATSNGTITWGPVGTAGIEDGWHAYDGSDTSRYVPSNSNSYLQWVLPYTLRFYPTSTFVCKGRTDSSEGNDNNIYIFYADSAKTIPMTDLFSRVRQNQTKTIASTLTAPVDTNTIYLDVTGTTGWSGFSDINFTGVDKVVTATGTIPVQEVYVGSTKIWPTSTTIWYRWYNNMSTYVYTKFRNPTSRNFDDPATEESNYYIKQDSPGGGYDMNVGGYISGAYGVDGEVNYIRVDGQGSPDYGYDGEGVL